MSTASHDPALECRAIAHRWNRVVTDWRPEFGVPLVCVCDVCHTERRDIISRATGALLRRYYLRPETWQAYRGDDRLSKADFRKTLITK